jgi:transcriptional regulator with XRE-family HTH domain
MLTLLNVYERIAEVIQERLDALAMGPRDLALKAGIAENTAQSLLRGDDVRRRRTTYAAVANALNLPSSTFIRMADGEDPFAESAAPARSTGESSTMTDQLLHRLLENQEEMTRRIAEMERRLGGDRDDHTRP